MEALNERIARLNIELDALTSASLKEAEEARIHWLGRKGVITGLFELFREMSPDEKRTLGGPLNELKKRAEQKVKTLKEESDNASEADGFDVDPTRPVRPFHSTTRHPISQVMERITTIFQRVGFIRSEGPEMEDDWHNFTALNFPEEHPARDMQDTFFIDSDGPAMVLRTHTSSVQIRSLEKHGAPLRILSPGRVFRNEAISSRSHCIFHQIEGLYVDKGVSFADLKQTLLFFARELFGPEARIRLRPSYFPFTEPSAEMDVWWGLKTEADRRITKGTGWLEILGCGMVHPKVLRNSDVDPETYSGYAFGIGMERIAMLLYGVNDLRLFYENDLRFLEQFK